MLMENRYRVVASSARDGDRKGRRMGVHRRGRSRTMLVFLILDLE